MSIESIQYALKERFAAPLPEFYQRRIIFWQDEEREFEAMVDELDLPGVEVVKLTGSNNFEVKKLLLHDDLTSNFLIYNPFSYENSKDNWLRDIELFSEEYRADYISMLMSELNVASGPAMRARQSNSMPSSWTTRSAKVSCKKSAAATRHPSSSTSM